MNEYSFILSGEVIINSKAKQDKYQRILEGAVKVFARNGFFQSTVAQVAKEAGVADGTIYLYFKNKDDILVNFFSYKTKLVFERFRQQVAAADSPEEKLRNLVRCHLVEFERDMPMAIVYQAETRRNGEIVKAQIKEMNKMYFDILGGIVEAGQAEGSLREDLYLSLVKRFILGAIEEVINTWIRTGGKYDLAPMADPLVDLFLNGIGSHTP